MVTLTTSTLASMLTGAARALTPRVRNVARRIAMYGMVVCGIGKIYWVVVLKIEEA